MEGVGDCGWVEIEKNMILQNQYFFLKKWTFSYLFQRLTNLEFGCKLF